jgi:hypothetical protein
MESSAATFFASSVLVLAVKMPFLTLSRQQAYSLLPPFIHSATARSRSAIVAAVHPFAHFSEVHIGVPLRQAIKVYRV